jgi:CubicO group peptidase (beta-lactamase class C family)
LSLDDPVADFVLEYDPPGGGGLTLRRLLSHASGVPDAGWDPRDPIALTEPRTPLDLVAAFENKRLDIEPGTRSRFSNAGYVLLGPVIERVTGTTYADFVRGHFIAPLKLAHTISGADASAPEGVARGFMDGPEGRLREAPVFHPSIGYSAGGMYSSVEDLRDWVRGLEGGVVNTPPSWGEMAAAPGGGFGLGWLVMTTWDRKDIAHGGGSPG